MEGKFYQIEMRIIPNYILEETSNAGCKSVQVFKKNVRI
jgi:hypothetical protein